MSRQAGTLPYSSTTGVAVIDPVEHLPRPDHLTRRRQPGQRPAALPGHRVGRRVAQGPRPPVSAADRSCPHHRLGWGGAPPPPARPRTRPAARNSPGPPRHRPRRLPAPPLPLGPPRNRAMPSCPRGATQASSARRHARRGEHLPTRWSPRGPAKSSRSRSRRLSVPARRIPGPPSRPLPARRCPREYPVVVVRLRLAGTQRRLVAGRVAMLMLSVRRTRSGWWDRGKTGNHESACRRPACRPRPGLEPSPCRTLSLAGHQGDGRPLSRPGTRGSWDRRVSGPTRES